MAVGSRSTSNGAAATLIESWDGTSWTVVPSPNPGNFGSFIFLRGVSCTSAAACTAAGSYDNFPRTLIDSWDGTSWTEVPSPNRGFYGSVLDGISCVSATACTAVGFSTPMKLPSRTLIESGTASS
jgi:hypothetical protein